MLNALNTLATLSVGLFLVVAASVPPAIQYLAGIPAEVVHMAACAVIGFFGGLAKEFQEHNGEFQKHQVTVAMTSAFAGLMAAMGAMYALNLPPIALLAGWKGIVLLDAMFGPLAERFTGGLAGKIGDLLPQSQKVLAARTEAVVTDPALPAPAPVKPAPTPQADLGNLTLHP
jgi:hypothetical protein